MVIRHKLMLIWAPLALCLVPILHGCTITTTTGETATIASPGVASPGVASTGFAPDKVPSTPELTKLTKETLLAWNEAIQTNNFTEFYSTTSKRWQKEMTVEETAAGFKAFTDLDKKGTNIGPFVNKMEPVFTPPPAISNSRLVIQGYYPTTPTRITFTVGYLPEADAWKLAQISVNLDEAPAGDAKDAPAEEAPAEEAPAEEAPAEEAPAEEAPAKDTP